MACMDHCCIAPGCDYWMADNTRYGKPCPKHGEEWMRHYFDEQPDYGWKTEGGCDVDDFTRDRDGEDDDEKVS